MCVDIGQGHARRQGARTPPRSQKIIAAKWKELQAKYEEDKKKDPDFAIPPSEDALPKPAPEARSGSRGAGTSGTSIRPVAVAGDRCWRRRPSSTRRRAAIARCSAWTRRRAIKWRAPTEAQPVGRADASRATP